MQSKNINYPRLLVISSNPFSTVSNNGKTLASFFEGTWPEDKIAQLYFYPEVPDSLVTENYYRITDTDILQAYFKRKKECGNIIVRQTDNLKIKNKIAKIYKLNIKNWSSLRLFREVIWFLSPWKTNKLDDWLAEFSPEIIFFCGGNAFAYRITYNITRKQKIPFVLYITDDYFLPYFSLSPAYWIRLFIMRKSFQKACHLAKNIITIGDDMSNEYLHKFGIQSKVAMNCVNLENYFNNEITSQKGPIRLAYVGSLSFNRWKVLSVIGQALNSLKKEGFDAKLDIFCSQKPNKNILREITIPSCCEYAGSLDREGVNKVLNNTDVLIHVEAFDYVSKCNTRLSISTKIPEYLASGKLILAIGPKDVASIKYLKENNVALVITDFKKKKIIKVIKNSIFNMETRIIYGKRARKLAEQRHNINNIAELIKVCIIEEK